MAKPKEVLVVVDENGQVIDGDQIIASLAQYLL
jgi:phosphomannomutase